jgi:hypothetical protein
MARVSKLSRYVQSSMGWLARGVTTRRWSRLHRIAASSIGCRRMWERRPRRDSSSLFSDGAGYLLAVTFVVAPAATLLIRHELSDLIEPRLYASAIHGVDVGRLERHP